MAESLKVAIIGYGLAGRIFHRPLIEACTGMTISAVVTANPERAAQAREDLPGVFVANDLAELWRHDNYDLVVVAAANAIHVSASMEAISNGAHVVVDKPVAQDHNAARDLFTYASNHNRSVHVFQNRRWDSDFLSLREIVHQEKLGPIYRFESAIERFRPKLRGTWRESGAPENLPGMLYDLGSHLVDQAVLLFGPAERVFADARALREGVASDDVTYLHIQHVSGVMTEVSANTVSAISAPRFRLLGLNGALQIEGFDSQEETLRSGVIPRSTTWSPETRTMRVVTETNDELVDLHHGRWDAFYPAVRDSIIHATPTPVSTESVLETMKVLDALRKSVLTKEWVAL